MITNNPKVNGESKNNVNNDRNEHNEDRNEYYNDDNDYDYDTNEIINITITYENSDNSRDDDNCNEDGDQEE